MEGSLLFCCGNRYVKICMVACGLPEGNPVIMAGSLFAVCPGFRVRSSLRRRDILHRKLPVGVFF